MSLRMATEDPTYEGQLERLPNTCWRATAAAARKPAPKAAAAAQAAAQAASAAAEAEAQAAKAAEEAKKDGVSPRKAEGDASGEAAAAAAQAASAAAEAEPAAADAKKDGVSPQKAEGDAGGAAAPSPSLNSPHCGTVLRGGDRVACTKDFPWPGGGLTVTGTDRLHVYGEESFSDRVVDLWAALTNKENAAKAKTYTLIFPAAAWDAAKQLATPPTRDEGHMNLMKCLEGAPPLLRSRCWAFPCHDLTKWRLLLVLLPEDAALAGQPGKRARTGSGAAAAPGKFVMLDSDPSLKKLPDSYEAAALATARALVLGTAASCGVGAGPGLAQERVEEWKLEVPGTTPKHSANRPHDDGLATCLFMREVTKAEPTLTVVRGCPLPKFPKASADRRAAFWADMTKAARIAGATVAAGGAGGADGEGGGGGGGCQELIKSFATNHGVATLRRNIVPQWSAPGSSRRWRASAGESAYPCRMYTSPRLSGASSARTASASLPPSSGSLSAAFTYAMTGSWYCCGQLENPTHSHGW
jgi:hypothetical protein